MLPPAFRWIARRWLSCRRCSPARSKPGTRFANLEIRFLGNRDANIHFALLTDPPDAEVEFDEKDALAPLCSRLIEQLNRKYAAQTNGAFFHFHRNRVFNEAEGIWMGWERSAANCSTSTAFFWSRPITSRSRPAILRFSTASSM